MLKRKKLIIQLAIAVFATIFLNSLQCKAQKKNGNNKAYAIERNEPAEARNLHFGLIPFFIEYNNSDLAAGAGLEINYNHQNQFSLLGRFLYAYSDSRTNTPEQAPEINNVKDVAPFMNFELGGTYFISKKERKHDQDVTVKVESRGANSARKYYITLPANEIILFGARLGYHQIRANLTSTFDYPFIVKYNGTPYNGAVHGQSSMMNTGIINLGVSKTRISDLVLNVKDIGTRSGITAFRELYFDVLYAPFISYTNVNFIIPGTNQILEGDISESIGKQNFGIRLGYNTYSTNVFGVNYGVEVGLRPGPATGIGNQLFVHFRTALNISTKI